MNKTSIKQLDDEFRTQVFMLGKTVANLQTDEQDHIADWLEVLINVPNVEAKARLRNDCMHYLLKSCMNGELAAQFQEMPTEENVLVFSDLLPKNVRSCTRCGKHVSQKNMDARSHPKK